ncbi:MAG: rod shape-determining protein MreD [Candidatus Poriferisodalaceae bacterium]|jgi:rod shape-determining protein MreD
MMASAGTVARYVVIFIGALVAQVSVAAHLAPFGYVADLLLILVVVSGLLVGPEEGAVIGFFGGLTSDLIAETPFGMWAFAFTVAGFAAGSMSGSVVDGGKGLRALAAAFVALTGVGVFIVLAGLIGQNHVLTRPLFPIMVVVGLSTLVLAPLAERVVGWGLLMRHNPNVATV